MNNCSEEKSSRIDTLSAMVIGFALTYPFNSYEQNALGNWFMLLGQVLETNATFLQLYQANNQNNNSSNGIDLDKLNEAICIMKEEIDRLINNEKSK